MSGLLDRPRAASDRPAPASGGRRLTMALAVVALLGGMAVAMVTTAVQQSPTIDEPVYLGTGVVYLDEHGLRYNPEHPPLAKLVIGAGVAASGVHLEARAAGNQQRVGQHLLY